MVLRRLRMYGGDDDDDNDEDGERHRLNNVGGGWDKIRWGEGINIPYFSRSPSFFLHTSLTGRLGY